MVSPTGSNHMSHCSDCSASELTSLTLTEVNWLGKGSLNQSVHNNVLNILSLVCAVHIKVQQAVIN